jgi:hypothetical protein
LEPRSCSNLGRDVMQYFSSNGIDTAEHRSLQTLQLLKIKIGESQTNENDQSEANEQIVLK